MHVRIFGQCISPENEYILHGHLNIYFIRLWIYTSSAREVLLRFSCGQIGELRTCITNNKKLFWIYRALIWDEFLRHFRFCDEEDSGLSDEEQERKGPKNRPKHTRKRIHQAKKNFLEKFKTASNPCTLLWWKKPLILVNIHITKRLHSRVGFVSVL